MSNMKKLDRKMATCDQFRIAVKSIVGNRFVRTTYVDKPAHLRKDGVDTPVRYISVDVREASNEDIENIEVALWMLGVTAETRVTHTGFRGTCLIR